MNNFTDHTLIEHLKSINRGENDKAILFLYQKTYGKVEQYIRKNSGDLEDAADIFQDGIIVLFKAVAQSKIPDDSKVQAYLFSICRNLWLKRLKKIKKQQAIMDEHKDIPSEFSQTDMLMIKEKQAIIDKLLQQLGGNCRQLLIHFYYDRLKMKEITRHMNFSSEQVAKNKKSACMKKLRAIIDANPTLKQYLEMI